MTKVKLGAVRAARAAVADRGRAIPPGLGLLAAVGAAVAGGAAFRAAGLPAAWLSGAMVAAAVLALSGLDAHVPPILRRAMFLVLGVSLGSGVTPELLSNLPTWPVSMAGLAVTMALVTVASYQWLRRVCGWDPASAYFGSIPGALTMTLAVAQTSSADLRLVSTSQTIRLFMLVAVLPLTVGSAGATAPVGAGLVVDDPAALALLVGAGLAGGLLGAAARVPAGLLLGAFAASGLLHVTGTVEGRVPDAVLVPAFVLLGTDLGLRFCGTGWRELAVMGRAGVGAFAVALSTSAAGAFAVSAASGAPSGQVLVAFAPGGLEAMTILAFVLAVDPAFVAAHHLARFLGMSVAIPLFARLVEPRGPRPPTKGLP